MNCVIVKHGFEVRVSGGRCGVSVVGCWEGRVSSEGGAHIHSWTPPGE